MKTIGLYGLLLLGIVALGGCKPTEKNYKSAYDAAVAKRQAENNDPDLNLPADGYKRIGDPDKMTVNGKSYDYLFSRIMPLEEGRELKPYNVAVAVYKMPTNCVAQAQDLRSAGYQAFGGKTGDDRYYVIIGGYPPVEEAAAASDEYVAKNKDAVYVGLKDAPVILQCK